MVHKIRLLIFIIIFIILSVVGITHKNNIEVNILKTLLPNEIINSTDIVPIVNKTSSTIRVVFEADNEENLEEISSEFINNVDSKYFELNKPDIRNLLKKYLEQPTNFLSAQDRILLEQKKYDEVYQKSIENLYNPAEIQITSLDRDPFLLFDDFLLSNRKTGSSNNYIDGKYYDWLSLKVRDEDTLSPSISNNKIQELVKLKKQLTSGNSRIYLAGTPIHSYHASTRSIVDINIICILSTLMVILLSYRVFRNLKPLLPIALSICFGMLLGFVATKLWFDNFQVITMVFSTTIIGIGIDYSYHYFFINKVDETFIKKISFSLITTIVPFILLYLTGIELLKQVAIFTIFGLIGIYCVVLLIYPCFPIPVPQYAIKPKSKRYKIILILLLIMGLAGTSRLHFNDGLTALYNPTSELKQAEALYNKISGDNNIKTQVITVKGSNIKEIVETEEEISNKLDEKGIEYIALSRVFPSVNRQQENFKLVKELYSSYLNKYSNILTSQQIKALNNSVFVPIVFDINQYEYLKDLMLDKNTSIIAVFNDDKLNIDNPNTSVVNIQSDIENYMKKYRLLLLCLLPVTVLILTIILTFLYNFKVAVKILIPSIVGIVTTILLTSLINGEINLFSIITVFLVIGFTMDYSIFRMNNEPNTESAIFISCATTAFSFLLLAFSGFKLLSSMALVLFFGIIISYLMGYLLFNKNDRIDL